MVYLKVPAILGRTMILLFLFLFIYGCGGSGGLDYSQIYMSEIASSSLDYSFLRSETDSQRSVSINNYGIWEMGSDSPDVLQSRLEMLGKRSFVAYGEPTEWANCTSGWAKLSPQSLKTLNPDIKVYRYFTLIGKSRNDTDYTCGIDNTSKMWSPITRKELDDNDWWLRDGNGAVVTEASGNISYMDVGKPGFKEAYLSNLLSRLSGKGFDGVLFDIWHPSITSSWFAVPGGWFNSHPMPAAYPTDQDWFIKAWKPFVEYVAAGVKAAGYQVVGNCIGEYGTTNARYQWQRSLAQGVVYEQFAVDWDGSWLSGSTVERRIQSVQSDPLEVWITDAGISQSTSDYERKQKVALAMFYIASSDPTGRQSYGHNYSSAPFWKNLWDFGIGQPSQQAVKQSEAYFWSRQFTNGLVLLNYDESQNITYPLSGDYVDSSGNRYSSSITIPPHTGMILRVDASRAVDIQLCSDKDYGILPVGTIQTIRTEHALTSSIGKVVRHEILVNSSLSTQNCISLMYYSDRNKLYVGSDDGTTWTGNVSPGSNKILENNQFILYCKDTNVTKDLNMLFIDWVIEIKPTMCDSVCGLWGLSYTKKSPVDDWKLIGTCQVAQQTATASL